MLVYFGLFILGLVVGSFLNVLIDRLPNGQNPFKGRSHCDFCKKTLTPSELVPLLSFLVQKGRCRYCKKRLSIQYPAIEFATGLLFVGISRYQFNSCQLSVVSCQLQFLTLLVIFSSLLVIFVSDLKYQIIPDEMVITAAVGSLFHLWLTGQDFFSSLLSGVGAAAFFGAIYLFTHGRGMGFGDVKLAFPIGLFLGFPGVIFAIYTAFLTGGALSLILILWRIKRLKSKIAFGPFLIAGTVISLIIGDKLIPWSIALFK